MLTVVLIERIAEDASRTDGHPAHAGLSAVLDRTVNTLITMRGLDLRLVDHIPEPESSSPHRLALEMIDGPVAILGWHPAPTLAQTWTDRSLHGRRSRHRLDAYDSDTLDGTASRGGTAAPGGRGAPGGTAAPGGRAARPLYLINLSDAPDHETLTDTLERLSQSTQVRVVSLGSPSPVSAGPGDSIPTVDSPTPGARTRDATGSPDENSPAPNPAAPNPPGQIPPVRAPRTPDASPTDQTLQDWVDELDSFDS